jgi:hypothetical protein
MSSHKEEEEGGSFLLDGNAKINNLNTDFDGTEEAPMISNTQQRGLNLNEAYQRIGGYGKHLK